MSKEEQIIDILSLNPFISQKELAQQVGLSRPAVANYIARLTKQGIIKGRAYILQRDFVLCVGAANIDQEARTLESLQYHTSNPVEIAESYGGVARNFASSLKEMGMDTSLLTAIGDDASGERLLQHSKGEGIDINHVWTFPSARTGTYTAVVDKNGENVLSIADMNLYEAITKDMINEQWPHIQSAKAVFLDLNFQEKVIQYLLQRLKSNEIPVYIDGVSSIKVKKLPKSLNNVHLLTLSKKELQALTKTEDLVEGAKSLIDRGLENLVIIGRKELTYAREKEIKSIVYQEDFTIDTDKKRNEISAKMMYGLLNKEVLEEAIRNSLKE